MLIHRERPYRKEVIEEIRWGVADYKADDGFRTDGIVSDGSRVTIMFSYDKADRPFLCGHKKLAPHIFRDSQS